MLEKFEILDNEKIIKKKKYEKITWYTEQDLVKVFRKKQRKITDLTKYKKSKKVLDKDELVLYWRIRKLVKKHWYDFVYNSIKSRETMKIMNLWLWDILEWNNIEKILEIMEERKYRLLYLNIKKWLNKKETLILKHLLKLARIYKKWLWDYLHVISLKNITKTYQKLQ